MKSICRVAAALILLALTGCATVNNVKPDSRDPFERANRATFRINDALDRGIAKPAAKAYHAITPHFAQTGVSNFFANLEYPTVILNDFLQAKFRDGFSDLGRFAMNTTVGLGGLFDPASSAGLDVHDEDFGQTLGKWGVPSGPYLVLPFLGPSSVRDGIGRGADQFSDPRQYVKNTRVKWSLEALGLLDTRTQLLGADAVLARAADRYAFVRSAYLQRREYLLNDGNVPDQSPTELEDPDPGADKPQNATPPEGSTPPQ